MPSPESSQIHGHELIEANRLAECLIRLASEGTCIVGVNIRSDGENHDASHHKRQVPKFA